MERQIANPMPMPFSFVVKKRFEDFVRILSARRRNPEPRPARVLRAAASERMKSFLGRSHYRSIASIPLRSRLKTSCCNCTRSPATRRQVLFQVGLHGDAPSRSLAAQEAEHLADDFIQVERRSSQGGAV